MKEHISERWCRRASELIREGAGGKPIVSDLTRQADKVLSAAFRAAVKASGSVRNDLVFVAIGGYGRMEMVPYSDIDIMLLARTRDSETTELAQSVLYKLWDMGLNISHCFRTLQECLQEAVHDIKTRTAIIDSRFLGGSKKVYDEFIRDIYPKILYKKKQEFVGGMLAEVSSRRRIYEDSVYLLEPNVKDGIGGLRDVHTLTWLSRVVLKVDSISGLSEVVSPNDYLHLLKAFDFLLRIRLCLHILSHRRNDVLTFEYHDAVSRLMGFRDTKRFQAPEIMMRLYYKKAEVISGVLARIMNISGRKYINFPLNFSIRRIAGDFYLAKNEITVKDLAILRDTDRIMEAFSVYSASNRKFSYQVKETIRGRVRFISRKSRFSRKAVAYFLAILNGKRVYETLREMHKLGMLDRFIPEFERLRHLVIYETYHRFTVDEHSLMAVKNLEALRDTKQAKLSYLSDIVKRSRQDILFLAILLHDIGKGGHGIYNGNHEESGYKMLKAIMERFGIEQNDRTRIEFLVRNHIVLSKLALARDSEAPETVTQLAEIVENEENLDALYLMTYADMSAVNPGFWTDWKAYLFYDLYTRTKDHLHGIRAGRYSTADKRVQEFMESMPDRYVISTTIDAVNADYMLAGRVKDELLAVAVNRRADSTAEITVATDDRPGLFSKIVGVLSCRGLNIFRARIYTGKTGLALDKILLSNWSSVWWEGLEDQLRNDLYSAVVLDVPVCPERGAVKHVFTGKRLESYIEIDNETSASHSLLELLLPDRIGLLFDVARQLFQSGISISSAVINTEEGVARDVFYLQCGGVKLSTDSVLRILGALYDSEIEREAKNG